jgi:hypothetical protein
MSSKSWTLERILRWGTGVIAFGYALFFFSNLRHASGPENDWTVPTNPQSMIALCLVTACVALWFLRGSGAMFAGFLFFVVMVFFGYWAFLTKGIRANMGVDAIPHAGSLGNLWIGATWVDLTVCLGTFVLFGLNCAYVYRSLRSRQPQHTSVLNHSHP